MNGVKIVFVDLDGTLKDNNEKISIRHKRIIEKLANIGIPVVFTTGRNVAYTVSLSKQYSASNYVISSNGAEIYNYANDNIVYSSLISRENITAVVELIKKYNLFFLSNYLYKNYTNKNSENIGRKVVDSPSLMLDKEIAQFIVQFKDLETLKKFENDFASLKDLRISNRNTNLNSKNLFFDITNSCVSKGNAIKILCDYLKINKDETMAIGDSNNDIEMLNSVKFKVAMGNASEDLKKIADYVTLSNDNEGVAVVLERLYDELTK